MNKVERWWRCTGVAELLKAGLETLQRPTRVNDVVSIVDEHAVVRRTHPNIVAAIAVPELAESLEERIELLARKLVALVAAGFALAAWYDKDVKQQKRPCEGERQLAKQRRATERRSDAQLRSRGGMVMRVHLAEIVRQPLVALLRCERWITARHQT